MGGMRWEVGRRFRREGTYEYLWLIQIDIWQKPTQYCKAIIIVQWKKNKYLKTHINLISCYHNPILPTATNTKKLSSREQQGRPSWVGSESKSYHGRPMAPSPALPLWKEIKSLHRNVFFFPFHSWFRMAHFSQVWITSFCSSHSLK